MQKIMHEKVASEVIPPILQHIHHLQWCRERQCADTIGTVPVPWLAVSSAKILIYFSNEIYGSTVIKQHSETVMLIAV